MQSICVYRVGGEKVLLLSAAAWGSMTAFTPVLAHLCSQPIFSMTLARFLMGLLQGEMGCVQDRCWNITSFQRLVYTFLQCVEVQLTGNVLFLCSFSPPVDTCQLSNKQSGFTRTMSRTQILTKNSEMQCQFLQSSYCWVIRYRHGMEAQWHVKILISWSLTIKCLSCLYLILCSALSREIFFLYKALCKVTFFSMYSLERTPNYNWKHCHIIETLSVLTAGN